MFLGFNADIVLIRKMLYLLPEKIFVIVYVIFFEGLLKVLVWFW